MSCDGEPAPDRELGVILPPGLRPGGRPKGSLPDGVEESTGELLVEGEPDRV